MKPNEHYTIEQFYQIWLNCPTDPRLFPQYWDRPKAKRREPKGEHLDRGVR